MQHLRILEFPKNYDNKTYRIPPDDVNVPVKIRVVNELRCVQIDEVAHVVIQVHGRVELKNLFIFNSSYQKYPCFNNKKL